MSVSEETKEKWGKKLKAVAVATCSGNLQLTKWEAGFVESINTTYSSGKELSFKQSSVLTKIYERIE